MNGLLTLLILLPLLVPVVAANLAQRERWALYLAYGLLVVLDAGLFAVGSLLLLYELASRLLPDLFTTAIAGNLAAIGSTCVLTAVAAGLALVPAVRRTAARWLPIDPASPVHATALAFAAYASGLSLVQLLLFDQMQRSGSINLTLSTWDVALNAVPFILFALAGVGLFARRDGRATLERLGLYRLTRKQVLVALVAAALLLAFDRVVNLAWQAADPAGYEQIGRTSQQLFGGLMTAGGAIALGLSAGIGEELLFRGAVQPRLGILLASLLFTLGHVQYGFSVATAEVLVIGLILGLLRKRSHTTVCILVHALYNAAGVMVSMFLS